MYHDSVCPLGLFSLEPALEGPLLASPSALPTDLDVPWSKRRRSKEPWIGSQKAVPSQPCLLTQAAQSTSPDSPFFLSGKMLSPHLPLRGANEKWAGKCFAD